MLGVYLHIPFCDVKCRFCNFYMVPGQHQETVRLVDAMINQISDIELDHPITSIYFGGGSPSHLPPKELYRLIESINMRLDQSVEFSIEVNPDQVNKETLKRLFQLGVNRLSIGAQSFRDDELKWMNRTYKSQQIYTTIEHARSAGFKNLSLDLIFALPDSTISDWQYNLTKAIECNVEHISAYSLTYEKGTKLFKEANYGQVNMLSEEIDRQMYEITIDQLEKHNIRQYEISNFAKPGYECQHNLGYWHNHSYIGIGPSAHSSIDKTRRNNIIGIRPFIENIKANKSVIEEARKLSNIEYACETAILMLRTTKGINTKLYKSKTDFDLFELFNHVILDLIQQDLLEKNNGNIRLTRNARPIANSVLCEFSEIEPRDISHLRSHHKKPYKTP